MHGTQSAKAAETMFGHWFQSHGRCLAGCILHGEEPVRNLGLGWQYDCFNMSGL